MTGGHPWASASVSGHDTPFGVLVSPLGIVQKENVLMIMAATRTTKQAFPPPSPPAPSASPQTQTTAPQPASH